MDIYRALIEQLPIQAVYTNHDYEPYARRRDQAIQDLLTAHHIPFYTFKDQVIFEKNEIMKDSEEPYTVFTPYLKKWKAQFTNSLAQSLDIPPDYQNFLPLTPLPLTNLPAMGFQNRAYDFPSSEIDLALIKQYAKTRDIPGIQGTSRLSVHLRFGTLSIGLSHD